MAMILASDGVDKIEKCISHCDLHRFMLLNQAFVLVKQPISSGKMTEIGALFHANNGVYFAILSNALSLNAI